MFCEGGEAGVTEYGGKEGLWGGEVVKESEYTVDLKLDNKKLEIA